DAAVRPGFQDRYPRVGFSGNVKERFIDESHDRYLIFIDRGQNLVGHRAQSVGVELRAVERQVVNRYGALFWLRDGLRQKPSQTSRQQPDNQYCQVQEISSHFSSPPPGDFRFSSQLARLLLGFERQLSGQKTVRLRHCGFSAVENVVDEPLAVGQRLVAAIEITSLFLIDEEDVIP